jgi:glycerophosphoryl diester phosphodiesterase
MATPPAVIAHRGASAAHPPGNTIAAFEAAGPLGATWVELDVRRTLDGALVVHHDPELPDGRLIADLHAEEIPAWVPTLDSALDACSRLSVNVEIKNIPGEPDFDPSEQVAQWVVELLAGRSGPEVLVSSFHLATIDRVRELAGDAVPTAFLVLEATPESIALAAGRGHAALHPWRVTTTADAVERCRDLGLKVNVWTVDDPDEMRALAALGVDGIVTNVPDVAVAALSP